MAFKFNNQHTPWEEIVARFTDFWKGTNNDRPLVQVFVRTPDFGTLPPYTSLHERWFSPDYFLKLQEHQYNNQTCLGEAFQIAWFNAGPILGTALFGYEPEFDETTSWFYACVNSAAKIAEPSIEKANKFTQNLLALYSAAERLDPDKFFPAHCDIGSPGDAFANILGTQKFLEESVLDPDSLTRLSTATGKAMNDYFWHIDRQTAKNEIFSDWVNLLYPGKGATIGEDSSVLMDPESIETIIVPGLKNAIKGIEYPVFHIHSAGLQALNPVLAIKEIQCIEFTLDPGSPGHADFVPIFLKILGAGKTLVVYPAFEELDALRKKLPPQGVLFSRNVATQEEGKAYLKKVNN